MLFGNFSIIELFGYTWFFIIGYIIYGLNETSSRDVMSMRTPRKWSWKFWLRDNWRRYLNTILCTYILFRFYTEISGHPFGNFDAVTMGLVGDGISVAIKDRVKSRGFNNHDYINTPKEEYI
jgi:hypothetical protein